MTELDFLFDRSERRVDCSHVVPEQGKIREDADVSSKADDQGICT